MKNSGGYREMEASVGRNKVDGQATRWAGEGIRMDGGHR